MNEKNKTSAAISNVAIEDTHVSTSAIQKQLFRNFRLRSDVQSRKKYFSFQRSEVWLCSWIAWTCRNIEKFKHSVVETPNKFNP